MSEVDQASVKEWLFQMHGLLDQGGFTKMVVTLWTLWYARRKAIYESIFQSPQEIASFVSRFIDELDHLRAAGGIPDAPSSPRDQTQRWLAPEAGESKFNVDGVVARSRGGGVVAVLRCDHEGAYLGSSAMVFQGIIDSETLETYACGEALALADDLSVQKVVVASDCRDVVKDINQGTRGPNSAVIHEIIARSSSFTSCKFLHERRNFNFEAHDLAKSACNLRMGRHIWLGFPHNPNLVHMNIAINE
ncbi:hypothetical protein ZWY2020_006448 [Hordeum vulgare]|nr:hypothetical protein ZWY2020_006448 [Hordeum vulgare]